MKRLINTLLALVALAMFCAIVVTPHASKASPIPSPDETDCETGVMGLSRRSAGVSPERMSIPVNLTRESSPRGMASTEDKPQPLVSPAISENPFYYYSSGVKVPLLLSTKMLTVRFVPAVSKMERQALVESQPVLGALTDAQELRTLGLVLLKLRQGARHEEVRGAIEQLNQRSEVLFATPVFITQNAKLLLTDEFIAQFHADVSEVEITQFNAHHDVEVVRAVTWTQKTYILRITRSSVLSTLEMANLYHQSAHVRYAHPNFVILLSRLSQYQELDDPLHSWLNSQRPTRPQLFGHQMLSDDPYFSEQWALNNTGQSGGTEDADIDAAEAWDITAGSPGITIAVLDDGVDLFHEDYADKLVMTYDATGQGGGGAPNDWDFHGTHCAGVAAANINNGLGVVGVCPDCRLMGVRIMYRESEFEDYIGPTDAVIDGIAWAADHGADVLSCSWGSGDYDIPAIHEAIQTAVQTGRDGKGCVVVFPTGNDSTDIEYPAKYDEVIAVGATDHNDQYQSYSNYGGELDVVAPSGEVGYLGCPGGIWTTDNMAAAGYNEGNPVKGDSLGNYTSRFGATSAAVPVVAGIAGLVLAVNPDLTATEVQAVIQDTADDLGSPDWDEFYGHGRVNAYAAVRAANPIPSVHTDSDELFIAPGEQRQVHFTVTNEGGPTSPGEGYLSISVSDGLDIVSWSSDDAPVMQYSHKQPGEPGWDRWGNPITLVRELLDAYETYDRGETRQIYVTVRGNLDMSSYEWIKYRATFGKPSGEGYINDPEESVDTDQQYWPVYKIPVWQGDGPHLSISPSQLNFTVEQGQSDTLPFTVSNTGGGVLTWEAAEDPEEPWLSVYPISGTNTGEPDPVNVTVDTSGLNPGDLKTGRIAVTSNDGSGYVDVAVSVGGNQAPQLTWSDLDPPDGNTGDNTLFTYSVRYLDHDDDAPVTKQIVIDGESYTMSSDDTTYDDGAIFTFQRTAQQLGVGNHTYHFFFTDGQGGSARLPTSGEKLGPLVASGEPWMWVSEPDGIDDLVITPVDPNYTITWTATDPDGDPLDIDLYYSVIKDTGSMTLIASDLPNTGSYTWDTSGVPEGSYYIYGVSDDGHGQSDFDWSAGLVTISHSDRPPSTVTWFDAVQISPSGQDAAVAVGPGQAVHIVWVDGGLYYSNSQDGGLTWSASRQLCSLGSIFEPAIATDASGNVHVVWEAVPEPSNGEIYYEKLDGQGNTLIDDERLTNAPKWGFTPDVFVGPNGYVHVVWSDTRNTNGEWREEIYYKRSTDGGDTWSGDVNIANSGGSGCDLRVPTLAADASNVYVVYEDDAPGDQWIYFVKGSGSGTSWGSPVRIDQGGPGRGFAYNPRILSDATGLNVVFGKGSPRNVAYKKSTNGGSSWTDDRLITDGGDRYRPDIASTGGSLYVAATVDFLESLDGGVTWSQPDPFVGSEPRIDANTDGIHVTWWGGSVYYRRSAVAFPPTIEITAPGSGGASAADSYTIEWIGDDPDSSGPLSVDLYYDADQNPSAKNVIALGLGNSGSHTWDTTGVPAGSYYIYGVIDDGTETASDYSDGTVTINHAPTVEVTEPDGVSDTAHAFYTVQWNGWDPDPDDAPTVDLYYDVDTDPAVKTFLYSDPNNTGSYTWETSGLDEGTYYVYAEISDGVNPSASDYSDGLVTVEHPNVPPTLVDPPDQVLWEDDELQDALDLKDYASDYETPTSDLGFAIVENTDPSCGVTIDADDRVDIAPADNWYGASVVTVQVSDGEDTDTGSFTVTVQAVNDLPWISPAVPDQSDAQDQAIAIDLTAYENDAEDSGTALDWYLTGEDHCTVSGEYSDDDVLTFTPDADFVGSDGVTLHLRDSEGGETTQQLVVAWENLVLLVDDDDNEPDARAFYTGALDALGVTYDVWDTGNNDTEPDAATLGSYSTVIWFTGDERGGFAGPGTAGEAALASFLDDGNRLFISSQDYYDDRGLTTFMSTYLGVSTAGSDVAQTIVTGTGVVFGGMGPYALSYPFDNHSDIVSPDGTAEVAFSGDQGDAAVNKDSGVYRTTFWGFPFEALPDDTDRLDTMSTVLDWLCYGTCHTPGTPTLVAPQDGSSTYDTTPTFRWDSVSEAASYHIQVDDDPGFGSPEVDQITADTSYTATAALDFVTYHWRVRGSNRCGNGPWSAAWMVTITSRDWTQRASMTTARIRPGVVGVDDKIYVFGGSNASGALDSVEIYDPASDTWTDGPSMPGAKGAASAVVIDGLIYVVAGDELVYCFDPSQGIWSTRAPVPVSFSGGAAVAVFDGKIYLTRNEQWMYCYEPITDAWTAKEPVPVERSIASFAVLDDKLYAIGGNEPGHVPSEIDRIDVYDPATDSWTIGGAASLATRRTHLGTPMPVVSGRIYVIGGWNGSAALASVEEYDPTTDSWRYVASLPLARYGIGYGVLGGKIYAIGGDYGGSGGHWQTRNDELTVNTSPAFSALSDQLFDHSTSPPSSLDLWAYAWDAETPASDLTYTIEGTPPAGAGVTLEGNRTVTVDPSPNWCGGTDVTVRATDPGGLWDEDTFRVAVTWSCPGPVEMPGAPVLIAPTDGSTTHSSAPNFAWHPVGGAEAYQIQVDDGADFSSPERDETIAGTDFAPASALGGGTYTWRVRGSNGSEVGTWSEGWAFTVLVPWLTEHKLYLPAVMWGRP